ncbi:MAG: cation:dicarboxylase symporter family transporter [Rickettsiales bacterium]|nr:cation:dicarboxylase symporter family transporter [Rickettsiales bacterium]
MSDIKKLSNSFLQNYKLTLIILLSVCFGLLTGDLLGEKAKILLPFGEIFVNLTFTLITPMIFFSVSSAVANVINLNNVKKTILTSILVFVFMSFVSTLYMIIVSKLIPSANFSTFQYPLVYNTQQVNIAENFATIFTSLDFGNMLSKTAILPLVIFSILFGIATKLVGQKGDAVRRSLNNYNIVMFKMINFLMYFAPIGLFAYFAVLSGTTSHNVINSIETTSFHFYISSIIFGIVFYTFIAYISAGTDGIKALKFLAIPSVVAFATRSSLATLPINFEAGQNINIPKSVSNISLSLGSIIHLDGSSLSTILKIMVLLSIFGIDSTGTLFYAKMFLISTFVCFLTSGVQGSGPILDVTIIAFFGFPVESLPILVALHYLIDPIITVLNTAGNIVGSMLIARLVKGKFWIYRKDLEEDPVLGIYK